MAVKKSLVSALPVQEAAAPSASDTSPEGDGVGVALDRDDPAAVAVGVGLVAIDGGRAVVVETLGQGAVVDAAGDPHAAAARSATRMRMAGPTTRRVPARARVTG
jgi:hypothetical protein